MVDYIGKYLFVLFLCVVCYLSEANVVQAYITCPDCNDPVNWNACYNGGQMCPGGYFCDSAAPYSCMSCPDKWLNCGLTGGVPTTAPITCPIGTYACNVDSVPGFCCSYVPPTDPPAPPGCSYS